MRALLQRVSRAGSVAKNEAHQNDAYLNILWRKNREKACAFHSLKLVLLQ